MIALGFVHLAHPEAPDVTACGLDGFSHDATKRRHVIRLPVCRRCTRLLLVAHNSAVLENRGLRGRVDQLRALVARR